MASTKTRAGVLRPRRADYAFIEALAKAWGVPKTTALRTILEHFAHCEAPQELSDAYWLEMQPRYDRTPPRR